MSAGTKISAGARPLTGSKQPMLQLPASLLTVHVCALHEGLTDSSA